MKRLLGRAVRGGLRPLGLDLVRRGTEPAPVDLPPDYDDDLVRLIAEVTPFTLTSHERIASLRAAVQYVVEEGVPGAMVECGVWRGGSMLAVARTLCDLAADDRHLHLYDTFWIDMPPPGEHDRDIFGTSAAQLLEEAHASGVYTNGTADQVRGLLTGAGYPADRVHIVEGLVEETLPDHAPEQIALCRLDTDFYESTRHELQHLVHRIAVGGVLIIDDYGHFVGARRAVDEYFDALGGGVLLHRIDFTGRMVIVTPSLAERARAAAEERN